MNTTSDTDFPILNAVEARVLGCLIEKKETTPDVYPLTLNSAHSAANQKTARDPVMALEQVEIHRALSSLAQKGLVRQAFASRVERYEHLAANRFSLTSPQIVVLGLLLLRGPQTAYELWARSERMARFSSVEELKDNLDLMMGRRPPLIVQLNRGAGQREDRFAHLLCGEVEQPAERAVVSSAPSGSALSVLEERLEALERKVATLEEQLDVLTR
ncbi:YceH family protein [Ensifer sp. LBL]|uniref:YceH family protein n=1 Tax=Ensifer sp. LBL TaxID=2991056 RepID=UPI003D233A3A